MVTAIDTSSAAVNLNTSTASLPSKTTISLFYREHKELLDHLAKGIKTRVSCCGAKVLNYFLRWTDWKIPLYHNEWVYQPLWQIREDLMCEHSLHVIREAIALLIRLGFLERRKNNRATNWRNGQDRVYQYRLNKDRLEAALLSLEASQSAETIETNPLFNSERPTFNTESGTFNPESGKFTVERHTQIPSIDCSIDCSTTRNAVEEEVEEEEASQGEEAPWNLVENETIITMERELQKLYEARDGEELSQDQRVIGESHFSAAPLEEELEEEEPLEEEELLEEEPLEEEVDELARPVSSDVVTECERLGVELNPKLEQLVLNSAVCVVKDAIAFVREKQAKGNVKNPAGYLVNAIKNKLQPTIAPEVLKASQPKFPAGFLEWYEKATKEGWVDGREVRYLSTRYDGEPIVFVPSMMRSMVWLEAQVLFASPESSSELPVDDGA